MSDLLNALHRASDDASATLRAPPLDAEALAVSIEKIVSEIKTAAPGDVIPQPEIETLVEADRIDSGRIRCRHS